MMQDLTKRVKNTIYCHNTTEEEHKIFKQITGLLVLFICF